MIPLTLEGAWDLGGEGERKGIMELECGLWGKRTLWVSL